MAEASAHVSSQKLVNWFHHHHKSFSDHWLKREWEKLSLVILKKNLDGIRRLSEANWYTHAYGDRVNKILDKRWEDAQREWGRKVALGKVSDSEKPPRIVAMRTAAAKDALKLESAEFRANLKKEIEADYQTRKAEAEELYQSALASTPDGYDS